MPMGGTDRARLIGKALNLDVNSPWNINRAFPAKGMPLGCWIRETILFPSVTSRHNNSKIIPTLQNKMAKKLIGFCEICKTYSFKLLFLAKTPGLARQFYLLETVENSSFI